MDQPAARPRPTSEPWRRIDYRLTKGEVARFFQAASLRRIPRTMAIAGLVVLVALPILTLFQGGRLGDVPAVFFRSEITSQAGRLIALALGAAILFGLGLPLYRRRRLGDKDPLLAPTLAEFYDDGIWVENGNGLQSHPWVDVKSLTAGRWNLVLVGADGTTTIIPKRAFATPEAADQTATKAIALIARSKTT